MQFEDPPTLREVKKKLIDTSDDGVMLNRMLHLPPITIWITLPLPTILWAYPRAYRQGTVAGQVANSRTGSAPSPVPPCASSH